MMNDSALVSDLNINIEDQFEELTEVFIGRNENPYETCFEIDAVLNDEATPDQLKKNIVKNSEQYFLHLLEE